ncbi:MAG: hypothetical protein AVDCRST_MAG40-2279, partial [uncultured Gemmatimonadaceae bacterium]
ADLPPPARPQRRPARQVHHLGLGIAAPRPDRAGLALARGRAVGRPARLGHPV